VPVDASEFAAWWGAVVATAVFGWEVFKWLRSGPRIRISVAREPGALHPVVSLAGDVIRMRVRHDYRLGVANVGDSPTTITSIQIHFYKGIRAELFDRPVGTRYLLTSDLRLNPGDLWSVKLEENLPTYAARTRCFVFHSAGRLASASLFRGSRA